MTQVHFSKQSQRETCVTLRELCQTTLLFSNMEPGRLLSHTERSPKTLLCSFALAGSTFCVQMIKAGLPALGSLWPSLLLTLCISPVCNII